MAFPLLTFPYNKFNIKHLKELTISHVQRPVKYWQVVLTPPKSGVRKRKQSFPPASAPRREHADPRSRCFYLNATRSKFKKKTARENLEKKNKRRSCLFMAFKNSAVDLFMTLKGFVL